MVNRDTGKQKNGKRKMGNRTPGADDLNRYSIILRLLLSSGCYLRSSPVQALLEEGWQKQAHSEHVSVSE